jgi:GNAT superfamily N-acetyltransferase
VVARLIRRAAIGDADALLRIQRSAAVAAFAHVFPQDRYPFPAEAVREGWVEALRDAEIEVHVAEVDGEAVASASIGHGFLRTLFVMPSRWGLGLGSALHDLALQRLRERGATEAKLWTLAENDGGRRFYERRGWTLTGETRVAPFAPYPLEVEYRRRLVGG